MAGTRKPYSILVVEDDPDIVTALRDLLEHDGYAVYVAGTCADAIAQSKARQFNAILLDLGLPDGDGIDVLKEVHSRDASLPVIIITAHVATDRTVGSLTQGAFAYLTKPYNREELRQTIRRAIGVTELVAKADRTQQSLTESENRFRSLVDSAPDAIVLADGKGIIISWNKAASTLFGYSHDEAVGSPLTLLMPERYRDAHRKGLARIESTGERRAIGFVIEMHGLTKEGTEFPIELSLGTWRTPAGNFYSGIIRDISWRKMAEEALRASEERLELVIKGSNDGFWDGRPKPDEPWWSANTPIWWSPRVREMLGYSEEEFPDVLGSWTSRLHPDDRNGVFAALTAHIEQRVPYDTDYRLLTKEGHYHWFRARGQAIWDQDGRFTRMAGSLQSIQHRKQAEETIRRNQQMLQDVADNTTAVIYVKDLDGRFLFVNRRFEEIFGLTGDHIIGRTNHQLFPREIADAFRANDLQVVQENRTLQYEEKAPHIDGLRTYLSVKLPLRDHNGAPYATCGISTDITERKRKEAAIHEHEERLRLALVSTEVGGWDWDLQTGRVCWSSRVDQLFGIADGSRPHSKDEWLERIFPEDRDNVLDAIRRAVDQSGSVVAFEHRVKRPDGSLQWLVWSGQIIRDAEGKAVHILGMVRTPKVTKKDSGV
ncbi:PAS domain S-box protein [Petrachloros mirabilis]